MREPYDRPPENGSVTCIACGAELPRSEAREYDKYGERGRREDDLERLCAPCHDGLCHQPRDGLEHRLVRAAAGTSDRAAFVERYLALERADPP